MSALCLSRAERVAVIENDLLVRETLTAILTRGGYGVVCFDTLANAQTAFSDAPFDALLADLSSDESALLAAWRQMRECSPALAHRVLFLVSNGISADTLQILSGEGIAFLSKPFAGSQLLAQINSLLGQRTVSILPRLRKTKPVLAELPQAA